MTGVALLQDIWYWAMKVLAALSIPLVIVSAVLMVRAVGRRQRFSVRATVIQALTPLAVLGVYSVFVKLDPPWWLAMLMLAGGVALGVVSSRTVALEVGDGAVVTRSSALTIIVWAVTLVLVQILSVAAGRGVVAYAYTTLYFSVGLSLAAGATLLARRAAVTR